MRKQKAFSVQEQIVVPPSTADFAHIGGGIRYGRASCPFCRTQVSLVGPIGRAGLLWTHGDCSHSMGAAAGAGFDSTILFQGLNTERLDSQTY